MLQDFSPPDFLNWYEAKLRSIYDGDTIRIDINPGLGLRIVGKDDKGEPIRLYGIDAWEVRGEEKPLGIKAREFVRDLIQGRKIVIHTINDKEGKYGRLLAELFVKHEGVWVSVNQELVNNGHAEWKEY